MQTIVELPNFRKSALTCMDESAIEELTSFIAHSPLAGDVIPGTAGLRKLRWQRQGMGKRGGARVIYYHAGSRLPVFLIYAYAKSERESLSREQELQLAKRVQELAQHYGE